jgi:hypothetical protein
MVTQQPVQAILGLTGLHAVIDGITVTSDRMVRMDLPEAFTEGNLKTMVRDLEILTEAMRENPVDITSLHNSLVANDLGKAKQLASKLGLTEPQFQAQGGGYLWVVVAVIAVGAALLLASDSPPPASSEGSTDGGTG